MPTLLRSPAPCCRPAHAVALGLVAFASVAVPAAAKAAGVTKCVDRSGAVTYSSLGCTPAQESVPADLPPIGVVPPLAQPEPRAAAAKRTPATPPPRERLTAAPRGRAHSPMPAPGKVDPAHRRFVSLGMSDAEVLARVGRPDRIVRAAADPRSGRARTGAARERWIYLPTAGDSDTITVVELEGGIVANVDRRLVR
jgi:hypothetical protein